MRHCSVTPYNHAAVSALSALYLDKVSPRMKNICVKLNPCKNHDVRKAVLKSAVYFGVSRCTSVIDQLNL